MIADTPEDRVAAEVLAERKRQIERLGWAESHDDQHVLGEIAWAAAAYCVPDFADQLWPWEADAYKPKTRRRDLIRAAALIVAEIERLDRADD